MRLPLPGPMDLAHAVQALVETATSLGRAATAAVALVPRLEQSLDRVDRLLDRAEQGAEALETRAHDADLLLGSVEPLLSGVQDALAACARQVANDRLFDALKGLRCAFALDDALLGQPPAVPRSASQKAA